MTDANQVRINELARELEVKGKAKRTGSANGDCSSRTQGSNTYTRSCSTAAGRETGCARRGCAQANSDSSGPGWSASNASGGTALGARAAGNPVRHTTLRQSS